MTHLHSRQLAQSLSLVLLIFGFGLNAQGQFTISNQEPITVVPNAAGMFAKPLPSNVLQHIAVAGGPYLSDSATMVNAQLNTLASGHKGSMQLMQATVGGDQQPAKYYGQASDPVYKFASCGVSNPGTINTPFHAPSGAKESGNGYDKFLVVWDQTNNNIFNTYHGSGTGNQITLAACPGGGHAGTLADPCPITGFSACGHSNFTSTTVLNTAGGDTGWAAPGILPFNGMVRFQEIVQGHINHAIYLNIECTSGTHVYPNTTGNVAMTCAAGGQSNTLGMPDGALIFLDYTPSQLADIKTKVDAWQYPFIEALTIYGGYMGDTIGLGPGTRAVYPARLESEVPYNLAGISTPHPSGFTNFYTWLQSQSHAGCSIVNGGINCVTAVFENIPAEPNNIGGSGTDITAHMHVADECIAKAQAGVSGGCPASAGTPSPPTGLTAIVR